MQPLTGPSTPPFKELIIHDHPISTALGSRGILLENQDLGGDV
jgi:hypothetical protein